MFLKQQYLILVTLMLVKQVHKSFPISQFQ